MIAAVERDADVRPGGQNIDTLAVTSEQCGEGVAGNLTDGVRYRPAEHLRDRARDQIETAAGNRLVRQATLSVPTLQLGEVAVHVKRRRVVSKLKTNKAIESGRRDRSGGRTRRVVRIGPRHAGTEGKLLLLLLRACRCTCQDRQEQ